MQVYTVDKYILPPMYFQCSIYYMIAQKIPDHGGGYVGGRYYFRTHKLLDQMVVQSKDVFKERLSKMEIVARAVDEYAAKHYKGKNLNP